MRLSYFLYWPVRLLVELLLAYATTVVVARLVGYISLNDASLPFALVTLPAMIVFWAERAVSWLGCLPLVVFMIGYTFLILLAGAFYAFSVTWVLALPLVPVTALFVGRRLHRKKI